MKYFARIGGKQQGPYTLQELVDAGIRPDHWVWCKGMTDWRRAREVGDICRYFRQHISEEMHPSLSDAEPIKEIPTDGNDAQQASGYMAHLARKSGEDFTPYNEQESDTNRKPRTWMVEAIITTFLCFPPTGFIAIYYGWKAQKNWEAGNHRESHEYARNAKMWCGITFFLGFIAYALYSHLFAQ